MHLILNTILKRRGFELHKATLAEKQHVSIIDRICVKPIEAKVYLLGVTSFCNRKQYYHK